MAETVAERLEYLRTEIRAERLSWGELAELQSLAPHIDPSDVELLEWAGVDEFPNDEHEDHEWGPVERSRFSGNPHRKCLVPGCKEITLDLDDEGEEDA